MTLLPIILYVSENLGYYSINLLSIRWGRLIHRADTLKQMCGTKQQAELIIEELDMGSSYCRFQPVVT